MHKMHHWWLSMAQPHTQTLWLKHLYDHTARIRLVYTIIVIGLLFQSSHLITMIFISKFQCWPLTSLYHGPVKVTLCTGTCNIYYARHWSRYIVDSDRMNQLKGSEVMVLLLIFSSATPWNNETFTT